MRFHKEGAEDAVHLTELWKNRKGTQEGPSTLKHVILTSGNHMGGDIMFTADLVLKDYLIVMMTDARTIMTQQLPPMSFIN